MRHTLTLDTDVDAKIAEECRVSGKPFKEVVNSVLRQGFVVRESTKAWPSLAIKPLKMGLKHGVSLESISNLEALVEEGSI